MSHSPYYFEPRLLRTEEQNLTLTYKLWAPIFQCMKEMPPLTNKRLLLRNSPLRWCIFDNRAFIIQFTVFDFGLWVFKSKTAKPKLQTDFLQSKAKRWYFVTLFKMCSNMCVPIGNFVLKFPKISFFREKSGILSNF